jgi:hypothetical protein
MMGVITIQCPRTGQRVSTGIQCDRASFEAMPVVRSTMHCWVCGDEHYWSKRWAEFFDETAALPSGVSIKSAA